MTRIPNDTCDKVKRSKTIEMAPIQGAVEPGGFWLVGGIYDNIFPSIYFLFFIFYF